VAGLAGVPKPVIRQAKRYLQLLEESSITRGNQSDLFAPTRQAQSEPEVDPLREEMARVNPDELTPREALELLYRLKKL
jgi:DNA mismatch repair protein MutS